MKHRLRPKTSFNLANNLTETKSMQSMIRITGLTLSLLVLSAAARAETTACLEITSVPYTIATAGIYCLKSSLTGAGGIVVNADDVTVDLNGHTLEVGSIGVVSWGGYKNITVRNGTIRGGSRAVSLVGTGTSGNVVERIRAVSNGIAVAGHGSLVRNNVVIGTTDTAPGIRYGIWVEEGTGIRVSDNQVVDPGVGYAGEAGGISVIKASGAVIERNVIGSTTLDPSLTRFGIHLYFSNGTTVAGNHITNMRVGISNAKGTSLFLDNTVFSAVTPFSGGIMAGTTNYSF